MEGLLIVFVEALAALVTALAGVVASCVGLGASLGATGLISGVLAAVRLRRRRDAPAAPISATASPWRRRLLIIAGLVAGVLVAGLVVLECGLDRVLVRRSLAALATRGGPAITADAIEVSSWRGVVVLRGVRVVLHGERTQGDLTAQAVEVDASLWSLLAGPVRLESVSVRGLRGALSHQRGAAPSGLRIGSLVITSADTGLEIRREPPAQIRIDRLAVDDAAVEVRLQSGRREVAGPLIIAQSLTTEIGSRSLLSAILLRTQASGSWLGATIEADTGEIAGGRQTRWRVAGLPAAALGLHLGPPWDCLSAGTVELAIDDRWQLADERVIEVDWHLSGHQLAVAPPVDGSRFTTAITTALAALLAAQHGELDLRASVQIDREQFTTACSTDLSGLGVAMTDALLEHIVPDAGRRAALRALAGEALRAVLGHWRRR